jgi:hypothetical protein
MGLFGKSAAAADAAPVDAEAPPVLVPAALVPEPEPEPVVEPTGSVGKKSGFSLFGSKNKTEEPITTAPAASKMTHGECNFMPHD